jgi:putative hydrolase of the HAD superfamily
MIRAVTFDAAGTLFAPRERVGETYARTARRHGIDADPDAVDAAFRRVFRAAPPLAFPATAVDRLARERAWWREVVRGALALDAADPRLDPVFDALFAHYERGHAWRVFSDVVPALDALRRRGLALGVVSNFDGRLPVLLSALRLASAFDAVVWSSAAGAAKPDPTIFAAAAHALAVPLASLLHVGDDAIADVDGARGAGARALQLDREGIGTAATSLADVVRLVEIDQA